MEIPAYFGENVNAEGAGLKYSLDNGVFVLVGSGTYDKTEEEFDAERDSSIMKILSGESKVNFKNIDMENRYFTGTFDQNGVEKEIGIRIELPYINPDMFLVALYQTEDSEYDYRSDFDKVVASIKAAPVKDERKAERGEQNTAGGSSEEESSGEKSSEKESSEDGLGADFKQSMDDYEAFFDEYVAFMKKYKENPSDMTMLAELGGMLEKESKMMKDFDSINQDELSSEELSYYLEVQSRILKKLSEVY